MSVCMLLRVRVIKDQTHQKPAPPQSSVGHWSGVTSWDLFCHNFKIDGSKEDHQNWRRLSKSTIHLHNILCPTLRYWFRLGQFPVLIQSKFIPTDWFLKFALQIKNLYKKKRFKGLSRSSCSTESVINRTLGSINRNTVVSQLWFDWI